jgi:hypothetical protein
LLVPLGSDARDVVRCYGWTLNSDTIKTANFNDLPSGRWRFEVRLDNTSRRLVVVDDLRIAPDEPIDPRLAEVDLRPHVRTVEIRAQGADGRPVSDAGRVVALWPSQRFRDARILNGAALVTLPGPRSICVHAPGHRLEVVDDVFDDRTVALRSAPELAVRPVFPEALPADLTVRLALVASPPNDSPLKALLDHLHRWGRPPAASLGPDGTARMQVRVAAPHRVLLSLQRGERRSVVWSEPRDLDPDQLPTSWEVRPSTEAFREALRKLDD